MPSTLFVSLEQNLQNLKDALITEAPALAATKEDFNRALGFRVLASAHLEYFVEQRCSQIAQQGVDRFRVGKPTRTGRSLLIWHGTRKKQRWSIPLTVAECVADGVKLDQALKSYLESVKNTHGMSGPDFQDLVIPLGLLDSDIDYLLVQRLTDLALKRQRAAHVALVGVKGRVAPMGEWNEVQDIVADLKQVDAALEAAVLTF